MVNSKSEPNLQRVNSKVYGAVTICSYQPPTSQNSALTLVDHQIAMTGVRGYSTGELKHNVVALAKAAKALKVPVVTTTARDTMWGPAFPEQIAHAYGK